MIPPYVKLPKYNVSPSFMVNHEIRYIHKDRTETTFNSNGVYLHFNNKEFVTTSKDDITFAQKVYYVNLDDLPPVVEGKVYIVSKTVANLLSGIRDDFAYPGTHPEFDGAKIMGTSIVGVRRFRMPDILVTNSRKNRR